jgi:NCAIR mutase (PurE)-related protein
VFAVPTSNGYGVAAGGETALRAVLASCSPGLAVLNIASLPRPGVDAVSIQRIALQLWSMLALPG